MDTNHLTQRQIERMAQPAMEPDEERTHANAHLQNCAQCQVAFRQALALPVYPVPPSAAPYDAGCLDGDLLARFVQQTTDEVETEIVEIHRAECAACRSEIEEMTRFYEAIRLEESTAEPKTAPASPPKRGLSERLLSWLPQGGLPHLQPRLTAAGFAAGVVMVTTGGAFWYAQSGMRSAGVEWNRKLLASQTRERELQERLTQTEQKLQALYAQYQREKTPTPPRDAPQTQGETLQIANIRTKLTPLQRTASTMGSEETEEIELLQPRATWIATPQPTFFWEAIRGAKYYNVSIISDGNSKKYDVAADSMPALPLPSGMVSSAMSKPPNGKPARRIVAWQITEPLRLGKTYIWAVEAFTKKDTPPIASSSRSQEIRFAVLPEAEVKAYDSRRAAASEAVVRAVIAANFGLIDDAELLLEQRLKTAPGDRKARTLATEMRKLRHRPAP